MILTENVIAGPHHSLFNKFPIARHLGQFDFLLF